MTNMMKKYCLLLALALIWNSELTLAAAYGSVRQVNADTPITLAQAYEAATTDGILEVYYGGRIKKVAVWLKPACSKWALHFGKRVDGNSPRFLLAIDSKLASHVDYGNGGKSKGKCKGTEHDSFKVEKDTTIYLFGGHVDLRDDPRVLFGSETADDHTTPIPADGKPVIRDKGTSGSEPQTDTTSMEEIMKLLRNKSSKSGPVIRTKK